MFRILKARTTHLSRARAAHLSLPPFLPHSWQHPVQFHGLVASHRLKTHPHIGRSFHSTPPNQGGPLIPILAGLLKASTTLEVTRTAGRIVLTFLPLIFFKNLKSKQRLKHGKDNEEKSALLRNAIKNRTLVFHLLLSVPIILFWATVIASVEQTPLTGRWRMIVLSPEEEDDISAQLSGNGWYKAVGEILAEDGPPRFIHPNDWRYQWVRDTLRHLESTIPRLVTEDASANEWAMYDPQGRPIPPPAQYPLRPRPRASDYLHHYCAMICNSFAAAPAHTIPGPPYSLLVVEKPEASNAFSYGFGPDGGGGVVVYSGFLDEILSRNRYSESAIVPQESTSWFSSLFGLSSPPSRSGPTAEQTTELAILLSHELSHLILSHHLETLSSATVFLPGTLSIISDIVRVLIFPITMMFGPFVNDAVAQLGKVGSGELMKVGEYCTSVTQEIEADVVSARLLSLAGFDARRAVDFWGHRAASQTECAHIDNNVTISDTLAKKIMGSTHPISEVRVERLKAELVRWETERRAALLRMHNPPKPSSISLITA